MNPEMGPFSVLRNGADQRSVWAAAWGGAPEGWRPEIEGASWNEVEAHLSARWPAPTEGEPARDGDGMACPVLERFAQVVRRAPTALAVQSAAGAVTYRELDNWSRRVAGELVACGARPGQYVAIHCSPSIEAIVGLLAVLKSGAAFVPVDHAWPQARKRDITHATVPVAIVTDRPVPAGEAPVIDLMSGGVPGRSTYDGTDDGGRGGGVLSDDLAYVIYTSGSTGRPRGVAVSRASLWFYCAWAASCYDGARSSTLLFSSLAFDLSLTAVFVPLLNGGTVFTSSLDFEEMSRAIGLNHIQFLKTTPSQLALLPFFPEKALPASHLVIGGEQLHGRDVPEIVRGAVVVNEYGPTEATVGCLYHVLSREDDGPAPVAIGHPIPGVDALVLGDNLEPVAAGERGELFLAGPGLASGYHRDPMGTASRFVANPYGPPGSRMYKTGDVVTLEKDELVFLGRLDRQVKVAGFRIEPFEVEAAMLRVPGVCRAYVTAWEGHQSGRKLISYFQDDGTQRGVTARILRESLASALPAHLVPAAFIKLAEFPLTTNGKIDGAALPAPDFAQSQHISGWE